MSDFHRSAVCGLVLVLLAAPMAGVRAGEANYQPFIVGDRAAGMGGAVTATAGGMDACFYNPAGLGGETGSSISVNGTLYGFQQFREENAAYPGDDIQVSSFVTIPTGLSSIHRLREGTVLAFSMFVPSYLNAREIQAFPDRDHYYNFSQDEQTFQFGSSIGHVLNDRWSVGASVFGVYQTASQFENIYWGDYDFSYSANYKYSVVGVIGTLGVQCRLDRGWSLGLALTSPSIRLFGDGSAQFSKSTSGEAAEAESLYYEDLDADNGIPALLRFGIGWREPGVASFGLDVTHHLETRYDWLSGSVDGAELKYPWKREAVTDVQFGGEYIVNRIYPLRAGFFTSFSSAPEVDPEADGGQSRIDLYGLTASVGIIREHIVMNFGLSVVLGSGDGVGSEFTETGEVVPAITKLTENSLYGFASTAYRF
jgi:hypothetical protein